MSLNLKQKAFADEYIITGNAYQSALKVGYSENYAKGNVSKLLENERVKKYMADRLKEIDAKRFLTMEEALSITASIARGEPQKFVTVENEEKPKTNYYSASFKERNQALEHFYKINAAFVDKTELSVVEPPTFIDDISGDSDDG